MTIKASLGLQQRIMPIYRTRFFEELARACDPGLSVFAGLSRPGESVQDASGLAIGQFTPARNLHLFGGPLYLCWQAGLIDWLASCNPDVLILEANPRNIRTPAAIRWMQSRNRPVIGWGLGISQVRGGVGDNLRREWRARFYRQFDAVIVYSQHGAQTYREIGFPMESVFVASNATVPRPEYPCPGRPNAYSHGKPTVLYVGRLQERKRVDLLLRASAKLPKSLQPEVWVVGEGSELGSLETLAREIYPSAHFFGAVYGEALQRYFLEADLFVLPGTGGLAVQEAMAHGLPVIVGEADGTQSDLVKPENGWVIQSGNLESLAHVLENAVSDLPRLRKMGAASYAIVRDRANIESMVEVFSQAVDFVLERYRRCM